MTLKQLKRSSYSIIKDESHNFRLSTYYIRPQEQLKQLNLHFGDTKVYSWKSGLEVTAEHLQNHPDLWLYYLCIIE
jgi:hypothetical protein